MGHFMLLFLSLQNTQRAVDWMDFEPRATCVRGNRPSYLPTYCATYTDQFLCHSTQFWQHSGAIFLQTWPKLEFCYFFSFLKMTFLVKCALASLEQLLGKIGLLFIPSSGHTAHPKTIFNTPARWHKSSRYTHQQNKHMWSCELPSKRCKNVKLMLICTFRKFYKF